MPSILDNQPLEGLKAACKEYVDFISGEDYHEDGLGDLEHEIFEKALEMCYGPSIWDRINSKL